MSINAHRLKSPISRDRYLQELRARIEHVRAQVKQGRESWHVRTYEKLNPGTHESFIDPHDQPTLMLGSVPHDELMNELYYLLDELDAVLKTVNTLCNESLDQVRLNLLKELQEVTHDGKKKS